MSRSFGLLPGHESHARLQPWASWCGCRLTSKRTTAVAKLHAEGVALTFGFVSDTLRSLMCLETLARTLNLEFATSEDASSLHDTVTHLVLPSPIVATPGYSQI